MKNINIKKNRGFTLMETLVTIFIFGIIMMGVTIMLKSILTNSREQSLGLNNIDQARRVSNLFTEELRNTTNGVNGAYPINQADPTQLVFFSTAPNKNGSISRVRYYISGNSLYKGITDPSGTPGTYNLSNEKIKVLLSNLSLGSNPLFYYYDGDYNGNTNPLVQPVNINQVKFIKMNIILLKQDGTNSTNTITSGASLRNLKTNLGN